MALLVVTGNVVLRPPVAALVKGNKEFVDGTAILCYDTLQNYSDLVVASSGDTTGFPASNCLDFFTYDQWQPSSLVLATLTFSLSNQGRPVDYLGIAAHNLFSAGASVAAQYSDDGGVTWVTMASYVPISNAPFLVRFTQRQKNLYRLVLNGNGVNAMLVGSVMMGAQTPLQRGIVVGHRPAPYSRDVTFITSITEGGAFAGRSVVRVLNDTDIVLTKVTPAWVRSTWVPLQLAIEKQPFFFLWRTSYSTEVAYGWSSAKVAPSNEHPSFMQITLSMQGVA